MPAKKRFGYWWENARQIVIVIAVAGFFGSFFYSYPVDPDSKWKVEPRSQNPVRVSGDVPDNIVLTPVFDMETTLAITWRTSERASDGMVRYIRDDAPDGTEWREERAISTTLIADELRVDRTVNIHTASLAGLEPGTAYRYRVGSGTLDRWSGTRTFTTAAGAGQPHSFVYFGDTQTDPREIASLLETVERDHPETLFYMIGGDLVDNGSCRNQWDDFIQNTENVFSRKALAPAMGNHDFADGVAGPRFFAAYFGLDRLRDGRMTLYHDYSFRTGGVFFVVLNNPDAARQAEWLEGELVRARRSGSDFVVVMFHHPVYNPKKGRSHQGAEKYWVPLFDKYGVDLVLSAHDHSYMRSKKLRGGRPAPDGTKGTTYVVANACGKHYSFKELDIAVRQFTDIPTYQILSTGTDAGGLPVLRYRSHAGDGTVMDEFELYRDTF